LRHVHYEGRTEVRHSSAQARRDGVRARAAGILKQEGRAESLRLCHESMFDLEHVEGILAMRTPPSPRLVWPRERQVTQQVKVATRGAVGAYDVA